MILISPYAKKMRNGLENPKNYPYWKELISLINEPIVQVGVNGEDQLVDDFRQNLSLEQLTQLVHECRIWVSVDSFFQHFCWQLKKPGIVLWGPSDPLIYGHSENINLLKSRDYLVLNQFLNWEQHEHKSERFVPPEIVMNYL